MSKKASLKDYVKKELAAGYTVHAIRLRLSQDGHSNKVIDEALKGAQKSKPFSRQNRLIGAVILTLVFISAVLLFTGGSKNCHDDIGCFVGYATLCREAKVEHTLAAATIEIASTEECVLSKEVVALEEESRDLFLGRTMYCPYSKNGLSPNEVTGFENVDQCYGTLKSAIYETVLVGEER